MFAKLILWEMCVYFFKSLLWFWKMYVQNNTSSLVNELKKKQVVFNQPNNLGFGFSNAHLNIKHL